MRKQENFIVWKNFGNKECLMNGIEEKGERPDFDFTLEGHNAGINNMEKDSKIKLDATDLSVDVESVSECINTVDNTDASCLGPKNRHAKTKGMKATAYITKVAILTSLSVILYLFTRFPIFMLPPFNVLKMDFSSLASLLGGFALGPLAAVIIEFIKCSIKLITSDTVFIGELSNFIVSISFVVPATFFYKYHKNIKGAIFGLIIGVFSNAVISSLSNYFIIVPMYAVFLPMLNDLRVLFSFGYGLAFNLIKSLSTSVIAFLLYKRVSKLLHL